MNAERRREIAREYKNYHLLNRHIKAVIRLEDKEDENFWRPLLEREGQSQYHFVSGTRDQSNPTGSEECLEYIEYVDQHFWIAVDSDLRHLQGKNSHKEKLIPLQTYTYSWENHRCIAEHLQEQWKSTQKKVNWSKQPPDFDFTIFLSHLSPLLFHPLALMVEERIGPKIFGNCLDQQYNSPKWVNNPGQELLEKIRKEIETLQQGAMPSDETLAKLAQLGVTPENAYLHVRGHNLYNLILRIGTQLCYREEIDFKNEVLNQVLPPPSYWQMEKVQLDIHRLHTNNTP